MGWSLPGRTFLLLLSISFAFCEFVHEDDLPQVQPNQLPKTMYIVDGDYAYLEMILNSIGSLIKVGVPFEQIYALPYEAKEAVWLNHLGVNILWDPMLLQIGKSLVYANQCPPLLGKEQTDLVMFMKRTLFLRLVENGISFASFDSDVVFTKNPDNFMNPGFTFGSPAPDAIIYGSTKVDGKFGKTTDGQGFALNGSPEWFLNPESLRPFFRAFLEHGLELFRKCVWSWGPKGENELMTALGVLWDPIGSGMYRGVWTDPVLPQAQAYLTNDTYHSLFPLDLHYLAIAESALPVIHFHGGGPPKKKHVISTAKKWVLKENWLAEFDGTVTSLFDQSVLDGMWNHSQFGL